MMTSKFDRPAMVQRVAAVSLVSALACAFTDARASGVLVEPNAGHQELSARVTAIVDRIRLSKPMLLRDLPPEAKIAQWRNR